MITYRRIEFYSMGKLEKVFMKKNMEFTTENHFNESEMK